MVRSEGWVNPISRPTQKIRSPASANEELRGGEGPTRSLETSFQLPLRSAEAYRVSIVTSQN